MSMVEYTSKEVKYFEFRWQTDVGETVKLEIEKAIESGRDINPILNKYSIFKDAASYNEEYPSEIVQSDAFFLLDQYDLRGISIYGKTLSPETDLTDFALSHSLFSACGLTSVCFVSSELSYAQFNECIAHKTNFDHAILRKSQLNNSEFSEATFFKSNLYMCSFKNSSFHDVYWEGCDLEKIKLDYLTEFDLPIRIIFDDREIGKNEIEILRMIRSAYERAELWDMMDSYLYEEKIRHRKLILYENCKKQRSVKSFKLWALSLFVSVTSGYSIKPLRVISCGFIVSLVYASLYIVLGVPSDKQYESFSGIALEAIYFSFTTFATLGYGDLSYSDSRPLMRILSTTEAWLGAIVLAMFVAILARKYFK